MKKYLIYCFLTIFIGKTEASDEIYICKSKNGQQTFSDKPCGKNAQKKKLRSLEKNQSIAVQAPQTLQSTQTYSTIATRCPNRIEIDQKYDQLIKDTRFTYYRLADEPMLNMRIAQLEAERNAALRCY